MSSAHTENKHVASLNKLLSDSVLQCIQTPVESTESSVSSGATEEQGPTEVEEEHEPEVIPEEEPKLVIKEPEPEYMPEIFPTPSLRLVLPDHVRVIEKQNRIHVLPEEFNTDINPNLIPKILNTPQKRYIDILAELTGCSRYKSSRAEFWFLDTLANLLRRAQEDGLDRPTQAILILWFCEWMKEIQHFDAADRKRMMRRFQDNMLAASKDIVENDQLPTPAQAGVYYKAQETLKHEHIPVSSLVFKPSNANVGPHYECCIRNLAKIIHYIFDLTDYQYNLVRSVFTFTPEYSLIEAPNQLQNPKEGYVPLKPVKPMKPNKPETASLGKKGRKTGELNLVYEEFLQKKAAAERRQAEQELQDMEQWIRKSHILPLGFAATEGIFDKYWPPPPPPPVVAVAKPSTPVKGKGAAKGKK